MTADGIGKQTVRDINVQGERVLLRADLNVPLENGAVADDTRIRESLPTIQYLVTGGASVLVCSHLGRPKGERNPALSLAPVGARLAQLLGQPVAFAEDCIGPPAVEVAQGLGAGDVALLENLRFHPEEEANDRVFAAVLGTLATVYVNDAFGAAHRAHASTVGVANLLPGVAGLLLEKEVRYLGSLVADPPRPFAAIVGGAKVSTKIAAIDHLLPKLDRLLVGGGMANTFLLAGSVPVGRTLGAGPCWHSSGHPQVGNGGELPDRPARGHRICARIELRRRRRAALAGAVQKGSGRRRHAALDVWPCRGAGFQPRHQIGDGGIHR